MTAPRDPDRLIHGFLLEGEEYLQDQVYDAVRAEIERKRQRTFIGPWRTPIMNKLVTYGLGAAAVIVLIFAGAQFFGSPGGTGDEPTPTATPSSSPAPALTQTFTSTLHGISMSYPEGWTAHAATEAWTDSTFPLNFTAAPQADVLYDPDLQDNLFLTMASQPIGDTTPEDWMAGRMASEEGCGTTAALAITVDGATGLGAADCTVVVVTTGGRGYWIQLYTGSEAPVGIYGKAWFEDVLATVQLQPEDALDPAPTPPLTQSFTSTLHGLSVSYPEGWTAQAATEPWTGAQANFGEPSADFLYDPALTDHLFLSIASQPLGDSTPDEWVAQELTLHECTESEPTTVDGATGLIGAAGCNVAAVTTDGRGYVVALYTSGDDPVATLAYDGAWFETVLATVQLHPEDAVD